MLVQRYFYTPRSCSLLHFQYILVGIAAFLFLLLFWFPDVRVLVLVKILLLRYQRALLFPQMENINLKRTVAS